MRRRLIHPAVLGFGPPKRTRRRSSAPLLAPLEQHVLDQERAFRCGARYSCNNWRRREPPRFRGLPPGHPGFPALLDLCRAFFRGYDAATAARYAHRRAWADDAGAGPGGSPGMEAHDREAERGRDTAPGPSHD